MAYTATPLAIFIALSIGAPWDGSPIVLVPKQTSVVATPNGSVIMTCENLAVQNNSATVSFKSGGSSTVVTVPALSHQPMFVVRNWSANQIQVTNTSIAAETPVKVQEVGTGIPGTNPVTIPMDGTLLPLNPGDTAATLAVPRLMRLAVTNTSNNVSDVVVIGGPVDAGGNNAYSIELNSATTTGPPTNTRATAPFDATTTENTYVMPFRWGGSTVFIANLSAATAGPVGISLIAL